MGYAICISRQFGSLGRSIGLKIAQSLKIDYLDRALLEKSAEILGSDIKSLAHYDESITFPFAKALYPLGVGTSQARMELFNAQSSIILEHVGKGNCVIVGRCADFILKGKAVTFSVFIYAPLKNRIINCTNTLNIPDTEVPEYLKSIDKAREAYYRFFTNHSYDRAEDKDMCVSSALGSQEQVAKIIIEAARVKLGKL